MPATHPHLAPTPAVRSNNAGSRKPPRDPVQYHPSTFFLVTFYIFLLVLCWTITCLLDTKPLTSRGSTYDGSHREYNQSDLDGVGRWLRAIRFLNTFVAVIALPVVLAAISHAAVVLMERRKEKQTLSLHELLLLADPPWVGVTSRLRSPRWRILLGLGLVFIAAIEPPLQAVLVTFKEISVAECSDIPPSDTYSTKACKSTFPDHSRYRTIGDDAEPADMATMRIGYIHRALRPKLAQLSVSDTVDYFASEIPAATNTGVLRYHALSLNSSVECTSLDEWPETCGGANPLVLNYTTSNLEIRVCVPGKKTEPIWTISRSMQIVSEHLYVDVNLPWNSNISGTGSVSGHSPTHCVVNTTRGYFELPNIYNNNTKSSVLATWPDPETIKNRYNDRHDSWYRDGRDGRSIPLDSDNHPSSSAPWNQTDYDFDDDYDLMPSPLLTTMRAVLGSGTWFALAQNASSRSEEERVAAYLDLCENYVPLPLNLEVLFKINSRCGSYWGDDDATSLDEFVYEWFSYFPNGIRWGKDTNPERALRLALYHTNSEALNATADGTDVRWGLRVYASDGTRVTKPEVSLAAKVVISILIGAQVIALLALLGFIYHVPSFSTRLDPSSFLILGAQLKDIIGSDMPELGLVDTESLKKLEHVDALVGLGDPALVEMNTMPAPRRDSDATLEATDVDSAANDAVSEATIAVVQSGRGTTDSRPTQTRRWPPYVVSPFGTGLITRDPLKRRPGQRQESYIYQ